MIDSKQALADFALRQLGAPVIDIEVDDEQLSDCIDLAIQFYQQEHYEGIERDYVKLVVTADDITNKYFSMPDPIFSVVRVVNTRNMFNGVDSLFNVEYQIMASEMHRITQGGGLNYYVSNMSYLADLDFVLRTEKSIRFNSRMNKVFVDVDWERTYKVGDSVVFEVYRAVDPEVYGEVYNDLWLKRYATQLIKRQWGQNLSKYTGMSLPGGITYNGRAILDDAVDEITKLEAECRAAGTPMGFYIG
jgi:hypothetical protein